MVGEYFWNNVNVNEIIEQQMLSKYLVIHKTNTKSLKQCTCKMQANIKGRMTENEFFTLGLHKTSSLSYLR